LKNKRQRAGSIGIRRHKTSTGKTAQTTRGSSTSASAANVSCAQQAARARQLVWWRRKRKHQRRNSAIGGARHRHLVARGGIGIKNKTRRRVSARVAASRIASSSRVSKNWHHRAYQ